VASLVRLSELDQPASEAAAKSIEGFSGATVSTVKVKVPVDSRVLPAMSVAMSLTVPKGHPGLHFARKSWALRGQCCMSWRPCFNEEGGATTHVRAVERLSVRARDFWPVDQDEARILPWLGRCRCHGSPASVRNTVRIVLLVVKSRSAPASQGKPLLERLQKELGPPTR
jgi:hypothetical protein